jgi:tetratricopeptide (TPR) repeat protein
VEGGAVNGPTPHLHDEQLAIARNCGQQGMLFEQQGNFAGAAQAFEQAIGLTIQSINSAFQAGVFVPPAIHCELGFAHLCAARVKARLGWFPVVQQHLFQALASVNQAIAGEAHVPAYHALAGVVLASQSNLREADRALTTALSLNPMDEQVKLMLSHVRAALSQMPPQPAQWGQMPQFPVNHQPWAPMGMGGSAAGQAGSNPPKVEWTKTVGDWADLAGKLFNAVGSYGSMMGKFG